MKKRNLIYLLLSLCLLTGCYNLEKRENVLKIYNWADYIDSSVLDEFVEYYKACTGEDIRIIYQTFDINEVMYTRIEKGNEDFDLVCPSDYIIERMLKKEMLLPIDTVFENTKNYLGNVAPYTREQLDLFIGGEHSASNYAVCYMWGTTGILYNTALVPREEAITWDCLWDPKYAGKILMKDSYREAYGTAIIYANKRNIEEGKVTVEELMNDFSPKAMRLAEKLLKDLRPNIAGWESDFGKEQMAKGRVCINMTWSGDAVWAIEEAAAIGVDLDYVVPIEGGNIWFDGWVIPKYAKNPKAASYFINFICRPDIALRNMEAIGYVSAIATPEILAAKIDTTLEYYSDLRYFFGEDAGSVQVNNVQYPDKAVVNRCALTRDFGDQTEEMLEIWARVKEDSLGLGITIVIFVVFFASTWWVIRKRYKHYKRSRRYHYGDQRRMKRK
ncbi:extracellular solute-binding protein [Bacteroides sp. 214]|uniref:ABC transporter substrate-binding protein n=1 Tax=Bacteroides sp. 214 TaxID=2302935 RepID=UPI0013D0CDC9|nr:ABC transporter substrate-binding protein [Bacteroides sp. 214]NDW11326.1 extracellular solute-binding protein [Bacteroides sp. 214]